VPKQIILAVNDDKGLDARVMAAIELARHFGGSLECQYSHRFPAGSRPLTASGIARLGDKDEAVGKRHRRKIEAQLRDAGIAWRWYNLPSGATDALVEASPLADLMIASPAEGAAGSGRDEPITEALILRSRVPLLIVPDDLATFNCGGTAMIAWNGSEQSALAMRQAVPLLHAAAAVYIVTVANEIKRLPPDRAQEYLGSYGIESILHRSDDGGLNAALALVREAKALGADYMVMGGYSRPRLSELIFGGVTRHMLHSPPIPLFVQH